MSGQENYRPRQEPDFPQDWEPDAEQLGKYRQWAEWARAELQDRMEAVLDLRHLLAGAKQKAEEARKQVDAYEVVISRRPKLAVMEPGSTAHLVNCGNVEATILEAIVGKGSVVRYRVAWWDKARLAHRQAVLPENELLQELPLNPPSFVPLERGGI